MLMAFGHYRRGFLLRSGGWLDQPYIYTEAMRFIDQRVGECEKAKLDG